MQNIKNLTPLLFSFLLILSVGCFSAEGQKAATNKAAMNASTNHKVTTQSQNVQQSKMNNTKIATDVLAPAETLRGTISFVGNSDKEVTLTGADGTPYDFCITPKTKVDASAKRLPINQLPSEEHKQATVRFVPTANGNMAQDFNISAS